MTWDNYSDVDPAAAPPTEPEEEDWVTTDHVIFREYGTGRVVATARNPDSMSEDVRAAMEAAKFWPNVWFISDHGNAHLMEV